MLKSDNIEGSQNCSFYQFSGFGKIESLFLQCAIWRTISDGRSSIIAMIEVGVCECCNVFGRLRERNR